MASALTPGSSLDAIRTGLSAFNLAVILGIDNTAVNAAGGTLAGLQAQVSALAQVPGGSPDALASINRALGFAVNAGIDLTGLTTVATVRSQFTGLDPTLSSTYTAGGMGGQ